MAAMCAAAALSACTPERSATVPEPSAEPQYGGSLNIGTVYITLSALSWDPVDWTWKSNHDYGLIREQLFAADLDLSVHKGGTQRFIAEAHIPYEALRGELAEELGVGRRQHSGGPPAPRDHVHGPPRRHGRKGA